MQIQEMQSIFKDIATVDEELHRLQECAAKLKDADFTVNVSIGLPSVNKLPSEMRQENFDFSYLFESALFGPANRTGVRIEEKVIKDFRFQTSEVEALQVLGVIVAYKEAARMALVKKLIDAGISVTL
ncbi:hypothetical protein ACQKLP_21755 [Chitinophaga sp. NPDC101104]|uniref:hypothetical protein n=1 Tax=Chitinophaga sp. NPDC101104 TaxID=3390561 RepID=UPI003D04A19F